MERFLPVIDLVVELLDARMPFSSRMGGLVRRLEKKSILVLGKADLANPEISKRWIRYFEDQGQPCIALNAKEAGSVKTFGRVVRSLAADSGRVGRKVRRLMVVGIPNVGKSTLINALAGRKAAQVANRPGVTRNIQWVKLQGDLELLDLPGILNFSLLREGETLRLINTMPGPCDDLEPCSMKLLQLLRINGIQHIIPGFASFSGTNQEFLPVYAAGMNFIGPGGIPDERRAAIDLLKRFQAGGFGPVSLEDPETAKLRATEQHEDSCGTD